MKVLYDYQIFGFQKVGGVSRYFYELLQHFKNDERIEWELPIQENVNEYLRSLPEFEGLFREKSPSPLEAILSGATFRGKSRVLALYHKFTSPRRSFPTNKDLSLQRIKAGKFDLFHPTYYDPYFLDAIGNKPFVLTVYDMIHEIFPEISLNDPIIHAKRELVTRARKVIAISESTKKDLIDLLQVPAEKIEVVYLGNALRPEKESITSESASQLPDRYLLFVGQRGAYKNFYFFIQALLPVLRDDPSLHVVCTGQAFYSAERGFFEHLGITDRIHQYFVDDTKLAYLYQNAIAFVFPSLYEGFGIPILEAFTCGCPVISSNSSSLPEVGGDAALYFEPKSTTSMREALAKGLYDERTREQMKAKGYEQVKKFSWGKTADQTARVYEAALG